MKRRDFLALAGAAAALPRLAFAQQAAKVPRIAFLSAVIPDATWQSLIQGLADFGYVDGKNIVLDRYTAPSIEAIPEYAARLVASKPELIITQASPAPLAIKSLTNTIPVVFTGLNDPVAIGLVSNYVRPGGNMTGTMVAGPDYVGKQLGLLKDTLPNLKRLAVLGLPTDPPFPVVWQLVTATAQALQIETLRYDAEEGGDTERMFVAAKADGAEAVYFIFVTYFSTIEQQLADLCLKYRFPSMGRETYARSGMLLGYYGTGFNMTPDVNSVRRGGHYVDLILKGAKPGDLSVEGPTNFDFVVNLKTAKALAITVPPTVLFQATEVIQ